MQVNNLLGSHAQKLEMGAASAGNQEAASLFSPSPGMDRAPLSSASSPRPDPSRTPHCPAVYPLCSLLSWV